MPRRYCDSCYLQPVAEKRCRRCGEVKAADQFYPSRGVKRTNDGLNTNCKDCTKAVAMEWHSAGKRDKEKTRLSRQSYYQLNADRLRGYDLARKYGITQVEYDEMLAEQGGKCAICGSAQSGKRRFHVDHDHETDMVRGLLCSKCNTGLGLFGDDPRRLNDAIAYLDAWSANA